LGFPLESGNPLRVTREALRQHLDRNVPLQRAVARAIDFTHAARADGGEDFVRAEPNTGLEGHDRSRSRLYSSICGESSMGAAWFNLWADATSAAL
jgi:hypothetical protein